MRYEFMLTEFSSRRFFVAALLTLAAVLVQLKFVPFPNSQPDITLAVLVALSATLSFVELAFLTAVSSWLLNWRPTVSADLLIFALLPIVFFVIQRVFPWQRWFGAAVSVPAAVLLFMVLVDVGAVLREPVTFLTSLGGGAAVGLLALWVILRAGSVPRGSRVREGGLSW